MKKIKIILFSLIVLLACTKSDTELVEYTKLTPTEFNERLEQAPIAYLPLGTLEWHAEHLPLGSDGMQSSEFFKLLAKRVGGIVLPILFLAPDTFAIKDGIELYGTDHILSNPGYKEYFPSQQLAGTFYWVPDDVFKNIMEYSIKGLARAGFKIIVAHGHGPSNAFVIENSIEWEEKYNVKIFNLWAWDAHGHTDKEVRKMEQQGLGIMTDHAAENETSLMMYFYPELIHMELLPQDTTVWPIGMMGNDPRTRASADLGKRAVEYNLARMEKILVKALVEL